MVAGNMRAIVLAAGRSTRFKRKKSKLATKICGRPMILFPLKKLHKLRIPTTVVLGYQADALKSEIEKANFTNVEYVFQPEMLGTGHAVLCTKHMWDQENILILNGDMPLLPGELVEKLIRQHTIDRATISFISTHMVNPKGYGRVVEKDGSIRIYEEKGCPQEHKNITKVNAGIYVVRKSFLEDCVTRITKNVASGEFYITDLIKHASDQGVKVLVLPALFDEVRGVNTLQELWAVEQVLRSNIIKHWMKEGVRFELAQNIHVDIDVEIGPDSFIGTGAHILGKSKIGAGCSVSAFSIIEDTVVGDGTTIESHSVIKNSVIGEDACVGPFARLRSNVYVADKANLGNFVEVKNSSIGQNSKAKHLTYIGDATIGKNVNIGAGTVVCNYDGQNKHKTIIEDGVFVGSNDTLIAPLKVGKDAYIAAGSTINKNVPAQDLAIARARQENKSGYAKKLKSKKKSDTEKLNFNFLGAIKTHEGTEESL